MILLHFLRMVGDLTLYYAFSSLFVAFSGSACSLPGVIIPSLCYALSARFRDKGPLRLGMLLPEVLCFVFPGVGLGDRIALLPVVAYTVYLAVTGTYDLSRYRQMDVFSVFYKAYPPFFLVMLLLGGLSLMVSVSLPMALTTAVICIYLMRVLRHDPHAQGSVRILATNALPLVTILLLAWVVQLPTLLRSILGVLSGIYTNVVVPGLMVVFYAMAWVMMHTLYPLLQLLTNLAGDDSSQTDTESTLSTTSDLVIDDAGELNATARAIFLVVGTILLVAIVVWILLCLFKKLAGNRSQPPEGSLSTRQVRSAIVTNHTPKRPLSPTDPVSQVRRQYRRYLRLCSNRGFTPHISYTSMDILANTADFFQQDEAQQLRQLYLSARYDNRATRQDAATARQLVNRLTQQQKAEKVRPSSK